MTEAIDQNIESTETTEAGNEPVTAEAIAETIAEFEQYRERLLNETLTAAKKAKMSKKETMANLEPELEKIDAVIQNLRAQHEAMVATN
ncbi:MAG: hypothetical protein AAGD25_16440 [Cyanobacteria bacterium P01_F01_bin.150]